MSTPLTKRRALAREINELWYEGRGWLKVAAIATLHKCPLVSDHTPLATCINEIEPSLESQQAVIRLFLRNWLVNNLPKHLRTWRLIPTEFTPIGGGMARLIADRIVAIAGTAKTTEVIPGLFSQYQPRILSKMPWYQSGADKPPGVKDWYDPGDITQVSYAQLRTWFPDCLFDQAATSYFVHGLPLHPGDGGRSGLRLIAMDREAIGMMWLET